MNLLRSLLLVPLVLAAPGGCADGGGGASGGGASGGGASGGGAYSETPAAVVTTSAGTYRIEVHSSPDPHPTRGVNELRLIVTRAVDGAPASGLSVAIVPFMPAMGHGGSVTPTVSADAAPGTYTVHDVYLFMPGLWELRATIATDEHATAHFDVP